MLSKRKSCVEESNEYMNMGSNQRKKKDMQLQYKRAYNCAYMLFKFYIKTKTKNQCRMKADNSAFNDSLVAYTAAETAAVIL